MPTLPRKQSSALLAEGKFLRLEQIDYVDRNGKQRKWEAAMRQNNQGAVLIVPTLQPSGDLLILKQYRPPLDSYILEFPAGLIDPGESAETTAIRELYEETGYRGQIKWIGTPASSSAGMTGETVTLVLVDVDEKLPENKNPIPHLEASEDIEVLRVTKRELPEFIRAMTAAGVVLDSRSVAYFLGMGLAW